VPPAQAWRDRHRVPLGPAPTKRAHISYYEEWKYHSVSTWITSFYPWRQPVDVYLIRHADALALGEGGITDDEQRPLSDKGATQARAVGRLFQKKGIQLDRLYTSPLLRARQTAEAMLQPLARPDLELQTCSALAPGVKPRKLSRFLLKQGGEKVGLVGHMPHLALITGWLIGDKNVQIDLDKAGVAYVSCGEAPGKGLGVLHWLVTPEWYDAEC
jgi:phosphohistidine phosphatase